jgi:hypothetical protein
MDCLSMNSQQTTIWAPYSASIVQLAILLLWNRTTYKVDFVFLCCWG